MTDDRLKARLAGAEANRRSKANPTGTSNSVTDRLLRQIRTEMGAANAQDLATNAQDIRNIESSRARAAQTSQQGVGTPTPASTRSQKIIGTPSTKPDGSVTSQAKSSFDNIRRLTGQNNPVAQPQPVAPLDPQGQSIGLEPSQALATWNRIAAKLAAENQPLPQSIDPNIQPQSIDPNQPQQQDLSVPGGMGELLGLPPRTFASQESKEAYELSSKVGGALTEGMAGQLIGAGLGKAFKIFKGASKLKGASKQVGKIAKGESVASKLNRLDDWRSGQLTDLPPGNDQYIKGIEKEYLANYNKITRVSNKAKQLANTYTKIGKAVAKEESVAKIGTTGFKKGAIGTTSKWAGNTATDKITKSYIKKVVVGSALAAITSLTIGSYPWAAWAQTDNLMWNMEKYYDEAVASGDPALIAEADAAFAEASDPAYWNSLEYLTPGVNVIGRAKKNSETIRKKWEIKKMNAEDEALKQEQGLTDQQIIDKRMADSKTEREQRIIDEDARFKKIKKRNALDQEIKNTASDERSLLIKIESMAGDLAGIEMKDKMYEAIYDGAPLEEEELLKIYETHYNESVTSLKKSNPWT